MQLKPFLLLIFVLTSAASFSQTQWDLKKCVEYAMENNISVKQNNIQEKIAAINLRQNKLSQYPNVNFSGNMSFNSGRNQDPVSFNLITQSYLSSGMQLQTSAEIFNWYSKRNTIAAAEWEVQAAKAGNDKLKNDIALTVANAYLQILLAKEQEKIADIQIKQSHEQLTNTRKLVNAGTLPELNAAEMEAQVARDTANLIAAKGNVEQALLALKAYMSLDAAMPMDIATPPVDFIPVEKIADLQPDVVYASAMANMPQQKFNEFKLKAAEKNTAAAWGDRMPTISAFGSLGSGYANYFNIPNYKQVLNGTVSTGLRANAGGGVFYDVVGPNYVRVRDGNFKSNAFFRQIDDNFRQSVGVSISVPIFNGGSLRSNYERAKLSVTNYQLQKTLDDLNLKQDIYKAFNAAMVAMEKFNASKKTVETAERSYSFAQKRWNVGLLSTFELITNQNNLFRAKLEMAVNQFDYVFKMKVLEFYKGVGLKL